MGCWLLLVSMSHVCFVHSDVVVNSTTMTSSLLSSSGKKHLTISLNNLSFSKTSFERPENVLHYIHECSCVDGLCVTVETAKFKCLHC